MVKLKVSLCVSGITHIYILQLKLNILIFWKMAHHTEKYMV
jgi:hypothetical protein